MRYSYDYAYFKAAADWLKERIDQEPEIALILGSSLGPLSQQIKDQLSFDYADIPNFLISTVRSHAGKLIYHRQCL